MKVSPPATDEKLDRIHKELVRIRILLVILGAGMVVHFFFPAVKMWLHVLVGETFSPVVLGVIVVACTAACFASGSKAPRKAKTNS